MPTTFADRKILPTFILIMKSQIFYLLLFSLSLPVFAQNPIGMPDIVNYDNTTYNAGTHNWDIQQDRNGVMYFANNEGVLTFDGSRWKYIHYLTRQL